jgi:hypothetical protein
MEPILKVRYTDGRRVIPDPSPRQIREHVIEQLKDVEL